MAFSLKNTINRYGLIAITFHWIMAIIIIGLLIIGLLMVPLPIGLKKLKWYGWHKEFGILILMLLAFRLAWVVYNINPRLPDALPWWQKWAAHTVHYAFYGLMFILPVTGWMISSSAGLPVSFFGLFTLPDLVVPNEANRLLLTEIHKWLSYALIAALLGHIGAALQHHFINKDDILRRMLP